MAKTQGDHVVKGNFAADGNAKFNKGMDSPYLEIIDQKARGVAGGTFNGTDPTGHAWRTRDLTNVIFNDFATEVTSTAGARNLLPAGSTFAGAAGEGGRITLERGLYYAEISCPAVSVDNHLARLADVTDNSGSLADTVMSGTTEYAADHATWETSTDADQTAALTIPTGSASQTRSTISGRFQLSSQRVLEIQHRCTDTQTSTGFGNDGNFYESNNVYTVVKMWKIRDET